MFHLGDIVKKLRNDRGWNLDDLARESGVHKMTISKIERGRPARTATLDALAAALGKSLRELYELTPVVESELANQDRRTSNADRSFIGQGSWPTPERGVGNVSVSNFVSVPLMDGRIAAGQPLVVDDIEIADYIAFPKALLDQLGVTKPRCVRVGRQERSMFPTIYPDAIVLLDCADAKRERPKNGRVYAVNVEWGSALKRVTVAGGVVFLSSDNADKVEYPMIEIRAEDHDDHAELPRIIIGEAILSVNMLV